VIKELQNKECILGHKIAKLIYFPPLSHLNSTVDTPPPSLTLSLPPEENLRSSSPVLFPLPLPTTVATAALPCPAIADPLAMPNVVVAIWHPSLTLNPAPPHSIILLSLLCHVPLFFTRAPLPPRQSPTFAAVEKRLTVAARGWTTTTTTTILSLLLS